MRKKSTVRGDDVNLSWYAPRGVLELTIHMFMEPDGEDGRTSNSDLLEALANIVNTASGKGWCIKPRLINFDESFYNKPICDW
jgi:hypothetical protein